MKKILLGLTVLTSSIFAAMVNPDEEPVDNTNVFSTIGKLVVTGTIEYTATTSNATNVITAVPASGSAEVKITVGDKPVTNGTAATWTEGANTVKVVVTDGEQTKTYTVTVTKE